MKCLLVRIAEEYKKLELTNKNNNPLLNKRKNNLLNLGSLDKTNHFTPLECALNNEYYEIPGNLQTYLNFYLNDLEKLNKEYKIKN